MGQQLLLPSAARTTQQICPLPDPQQAGYRGIVVFLNVTVYSTGGLNVRVRFTDPVSGAVYDGQVGSAVEATGLKIFQIGPDGAFATLDGGSLQVYLPDTNPILVITPNDGSSITYSVGIDYR
jgi:hypothetical protein